MAGQYYTGTLLASPIVRGSSGDTYGTHHSILGVGGYMEVSTIVERDALPVDYTNGINFDGLSSGQRRLGMLIHVYENNIIYHLQPSVAYSVWSGYTTNQKLTALADNNNWNVFLTSGGTSTAGEKISKDFYQLTHGFIVGDVIGFNGSIFIKVSTTTAISVEPLGIVSTVKDISNFTLTFSGNINTTGVVDYSGGTLTAGRTYYLASISGKLSKFSPTGLTQVSKPMLITLASGNTGIVIQYRGTTQTQLGVTLGQFNTYTGTTQTFLNKTVTGATNVGYFSGSTGIQKLIISNTINPAYNGEYDSVYNYYYRDINGIIRIGSPIYNGPLRRGYVRTIPTPVKSWIYNTYTGLTNQVGWILVDGDITKTVGTFLNAFPAVGAMYSGITWSTGAYNNGGNVVLNVSGSLTTGTTYNIGGPVYVNKTNQQLHLRTIMSKTNDLIRVSYDDNFVFISGATQTSTGTTSGTTNAVNIGTGIGLFDSKVNNCLRFNSLLGSGSTALSQVGNTIVVHDAKYNLNSPATCTVGGITIGTALTGKTVFQLFQDILAPELFGTLTAPSTSILLSPSGTFEIGCSISSLNITGCFNRGSISPQYCSTSPFRSGTANKYCFTGSQVAGLYVCSGSSVVKTANNYVVSGGSQTWSVDTTYNSGIQPKGSGGSNYCSPLSSGTTSFASSSISGILPWYWGKCTSQVLGSSDIAAGNKCIASASGTLPIIFNSSPSDYIWFAVPNGTSVKTCWYVSSLNNGCIGGIGNLFATDCIVAVTSAQGCWTGCNYMVYVSCTTTGTACGVPMCVS